MNNRSISLFSLFSAFCLLISITVLAVDSTWIGGSTGNWNSEGNWSAGIPQTADDTATINSPVTIEVPSSITLECLNVEAGIRLHIPVAATSSSVAISNLIRAAAATLDVSAPEIGTVSNALFVGNFEPGPIPVWFTVNGLSASYSETLGVVPTTATGATYSLSALGPSTVPNDSTSAAVINSAGTSGGITLANDPTTLFSLTQDHAANPATVDLGGQSLAASVVAITATGNSLSLTNGILSTPSAQTPPSGAVSFPALPTDPIAWFDLADSTTVTTNSEGRITLLVNKGSRGSDLDANVPADRIGPRYVPNAVNGRGVARSDGYMPPQGLATLNNVGITGNAPRTAFIVAARLPHAPANFYALSLGPDGGSNLTFGFVERPDRTSFVTTGNDLDLYPASSAGHNVLTFITGLGGTPDAGDGFRNGVSAGTKTFALNTVDNLIYLLHRPRTASNFSGPGEVAEALVFDYTLSESERLAVELYLMQKWGVAAEREETLLALQNDNPAAELAVSATLSDPYATTLALAKSGPGDVVLDGPLSFIGSLLLDEGALIFDTPSTHTSILSSSIRGPGTLVKTGPGNLTLSLPSLYTGGTKVESGTLFSGLNGSLGSGSVVITNNGALDIVNGPAVLPAIGTGVIANPVTVQGAGPDGLGALRNSSVIPQLNAFRSVALTGDAAVYSASRFDVRNGSFDFGGHSLTVNGDGEFAIANSDIANVTDSTSVNVEDGMMRFEQSDFEGSALNVADVSAGSDVCLYQMEVPMQWSLLLADNACFYANNGGMDTNLNRWAGPVTLSSGTARFNAPAEGTASITGAVGGNGGLLKDGEGWFWLFNPVNTYAGATTVSQGNLYAVSPGSLGTQAAAGLTVSDTGSFVARVASNTSIDGWTASELNAIANSSAFTAGTSTSLGFDTIYEDFNYTGDFPYIGLSKVGPYALTLTGDAPDLGPLTVYDGELDLSGSGDHNLHTHSVYVGASAAAELPAILRLADTTLKVDDPGYLRPSPSLIVGSAANARGIVYVGTNTVVNGRLLAGYATDSAGAVYQSSGVVTNMGGSASDSNIGTYGYGYYRLDGGELANKGYLLLGRISGSTGVFEQRGGSCLINPGIAPDEGVVGDYYNGSLSTRAGVGVFVLSGGTFNLDAHSLQLGEWSGENDFMDGTATFTVENDAQVDVSYVMLANRNGSPEAYVNLNGGTFTTQYFQKGGSNAADNTGKAVVSFNGGTLRIPDSGAASSLVRTGADNTPALLNVNLGGAIIDTLDGADITLDQPLNAPSNLGVSGIAISSSGAGYIAAPAVLISEGNGIGATAVAEVDTASGMLTGIRVTSPGSGYTSTPTVTLRGGGYTSLAVANASLGGNSSGGLTKLGTGTLDLTAANTYTGPTVVSNGVLRLSAGNQTISAASSLAVTGGTLDLGGATHTNFNPVTIESGRLINGTISTPSFTKTGPGAATLIARAAAPDPAVLREAFIQSLGPVIWYDPSDTTPGNVSTNDSGRVYLLRNKGTLGATHDAIPYIGSGPLLLSGAASPSPLGSGVLHIDTATSAMTTAANVPITGSTPRTIVALLARSGGNRTAVGLGTGGAGQTFEIGNDYLKTYITGIDGRDTQFTTGIPAENQLTFIAAVNGFGGSYTRGVQLWRSIGENLETLTATWGVDLGTAEVPLSIGKRGTGTYQGKIGEVLIFDRILTESEVAALKDALVAKYLSVPAGEESAAVPTITVAEGTLCLAPGTETIAALAPAVWYDPSDSSSVTTNASGRLTGMLNKGSKPEMDAVSGISNGGIALLAPQLATGALSYAASGLPMIGIDANNCGLASGANTDITGTAPRTTAGVFARDNNSGGPIVAFGNNSAAQLWEFGDRNNSTVVGCFGGGNDMFVQPLNPVQQANVFVADNTGTKDIEFWRTGLAPNYSSFTIADTFATGNSRWFIGQRPNTVNRSDFRGQIGELLLFDRLLTEAERIDLQDYLVNKWMLPEGTGADSFYNGVVFDVAAGATLDLEGTRDNLTVTGSGTLANGTLGAGFVISPAGDSAIGELALSNISFVAGAEYRLTTSDNTSDRLLVDGDLSALTVVPATDAEMTESSYIIATGAIIGKPILSGFPSKFKIIRTGADLLLTSSGGTLIIIR
ncbi:MAG: autotransporter-associated beta strand repeat-containing protein [Kiritimatiellae bacterium]|jgi:autotransporter-associated beta strand protein|nr:autotransporter-associated beta strand repeat-containing protein [Kiritimatiellia bacterium]